MHGRVRGTDVDHDLLGALGHLEQPLARGLERMPPAHRVVLAHRVPHEGVVGQQAGQVRVSFEDDPVEVPGLALEPVRPQEERGDGGELGVGLGDGRRQPDVVLFRDRVEMQHHLEALGRLVLVEVVDRAQVQEEPEIQLGVVAQQAHRLDPGPPGDPNGEVAAEVRHRQHTLAEGLVEHAYGRPGEQLRRQGDGGASHGAPPSPARAAPGDPPSAGPGRPAPRSPGPRPGAAAAGRPPPPRSIPGDSPAAASSAAGRS